MGWTVHPRIDQETVARVESVLALRFQSNYAVRRRDIGSISFRLGLPASVVEKVWNRLKDGTFARNSGIDVAVGEYKGKGIAKKQGVDEPVNLGRITNAIDTEWAETGSHTAAFKRAISGKAPPGRREKPRVKWLTK